MSPEDAQLIEEMKKFEAMVQDLSVHLGEDDHVGNAKLYAAAKQAMGIGLFAQQECERLARAGRNWRWLLIGLFMAIEAVQHLVK